MSILNDFDGFDSDFDSDSFDSDFDSDLGGDHHENEDWGWPDNQEQDIPMDLTLDDDTLDVPGEDLDALEERANEIERDKEPGDISFKRKNCATRHGCTGATNCNYGYASYPG